MIYFSKYREEKGRAEKADTEVLNDDSEAVYLACFYSTEGNFEMIKFLHSKVDHPSLRHSNRPRSPSSSRSYGAPGATPGRRRSRNVRAKYATRPR